jgi:hypothetical protein
MCWFNLHKWKVIRLWNYIDTSYSIEGEHSCLITYQCSICNEIKTKIVGGWLHKEDLIKENNT